MKNRFLLALLSGLAFPALVFSADGVKLGDPSLTAGVPGTGALTPSDVKTYLSNPANHSVLSVELPDGLAAGKEAIYRSFIGTWLGVLLKHCPLLFSRNKTRQS